MQVAVIDGGVSELSKLFRGQRDGVLSERVIIASKEKSRPVDLLVDVISSGSEGGLVSVVASKSSIENRVEASSGKARSSGSSVLKVERSSEGSSSVDIFSGSRIWKSSSVRVDSSRSEGDISSSNEGEGERVIRLVVGSLEFVSNRVSVSDSDVVSGNESSFNVSSVGNERIE